MAEKKIVWLENGLSIGNGASSLGLNRKCMDIGYHAFCLEKIRNNPIRPFSTHTIFFPAITLIRNQRVRDMLSFYDCTILLQNFRKQLVNNLS